ncbi:hypothetical protein ABEW61_13245 [Paenibacillus amylolyticus]|uniref:hypothetical protein n=1 Tax=Paenibacillus amylolyticus TaxID=1451 RepID=UPI003D2977E6
MSYSRKLVNLKALLLSACGKSDDTDTLSNSEEPSKSTRQAPPINNTPTNTERLIEPAEKEEIKNITATDF